MSLHTPRRDAVSRPRGDDVEEVIYVLHVLHPHLGFALRALDGVEDFVLA
eukprot:CAMPEP_0182891692 /NCGR_PEP_ID=MMETSP0034_2-20130328/23415_1 /TAXON_ID=156128 /ORGANISM="Nephroselmis pyriformis, Strain CCMP717" /LENGTH=49 /DNA_ID= /DNA_START= /DNA_END= /DNA_ORIENTATION=